MKLGQFWQREKSTGWIWAESIVITFLVLFLCYITNPSNPFYVKSIFPWPWIACIIIALQYGFGPGLVSLLVIAFAIGMNASFAALAIAPYQMYLLTGMLLVCLCALYSSSWMQRVLRAEELYNYTEQRLDTLSRSYNILRVSYDYLEQSLISKPITLREIEKNLQLALLQSEGQITPASATQFLEMASQYCGLQDAGIFLMHGKEPTLRPVAAIGNINQLDNNDPLVRHVIDSDDLNYVTLNDMTDPSNAGYLVVVPMYASNKNLVGILVVKEMSFWKLNAETLQILQILSLYFAEEVTVVDQTKNLLLSFPDCPPEFLKELEKLLHIKRSINIDSSMVAIRIYPSPQMNNLIHVLKKQQRGLDYLWDHDEDGSHVLLTLMPFTNEIGISGYLTRVSNTLTENFGKSMQELGMVARYISLYDQKAEVIITDLIQATHVDMDATVDD